MLTPTGRRQPKQDRSAPDSRPADAGGSIAAGYLRISGQCTKCGETNHVTQTCRHEHAVTCIVCGQQGHKSKDHTKRDYETGWNNTAMPRIESDVLNIRSVITRCRSVSQHRTSGVNADNLITLTNSSRWSLPWFLNVNAQSLSIDKLNELLVVARMNDVACVNVTETWFKNYMASESAGLAGFCCERKDRVERGCGGVTCHVTETAVYERLHDIEDDEHEVLWTRLKPKKLPRKYSCIIIACIYHPPGADNVSLREYLITSLDTVLRRSPDCGVILSGDFNQFNDSFYAHIMDTSNLLWQPHVIEQF